VTALAALVSLLLALIVFLGCARAAGHVGGVLL